MFVELLILLTATDYSSCLEVNVMINYLVLTTYLLNLSSTSVVAALTCYSGFNQEARPRQCDSNIDHCTITGNCIVREDSHKTEVYC